MLGWFQVWLYSVRFFLQGRNIRFLFVKLHAVFIGQEGHAVSWTEHDESRERR